MPTKTFIIGKDASLEDSITKMQAILKKAGFKIEETSWLNPVENIYSVHIRDKNCSVLFANGKGFCKKSCLASAYGEFIERLATNYFFSDFFIDLDAVKDDFLYYLNEKKLTLKEYKLCLNKKLWALYDAGGELQAEDFLSLNDAKQQITCLPMNNAVTNEEVYFPINIFSNLYASNGLCAGNTILEAKVQGLSEIFERWVKGIILRENLCLPKLSNKNIEKYLNITIAIENLKKKGLEISLRDASLGGHFPVISVILFEQATGQCFASFGAHPIFEVALERTLTEALQGRSLHKLDGFQTPVFDAELVANDENIENHFIDSSGLINAKFISTNYDYKLSNWSFEGTIEQQYLYLVNKITQMDRVVYTADFNHYGLPASRVIVPGMSEIFPIEELIDNNQNQGRILRESLEQLSQNKVQQQIQQTLEVVQQLGLSDHQGVASLIGLLADKNSYWQKLKIIELKMFLQLAQQNHEECFESLQTCFYFVDDKAMKVFYKALSFALEVKLYKNQAIYNTEMLIALFGKQTTEKVTKSINGDLFLYGLPIGDEVFRQNLAHQRLVEIYKRLPVAINVD